MKDVAGLLPVHFLQNIIKVYEYCTSWAKRTIENKYETNIEVHYVKPAFSMYDKKKTFSVVMTERVV